MQYSGTFKLHQKGFGFIQTSLGQSIFVPPKLAKRFFTFDVVEVDAEQDEEKRWSATNVALLDGATRTLSGTVQMENDTPWFVPEHPLLSKFPIFAENTAPVAHRDKLVCTALLTPNGWVMEVNFNAGNEHSKNWESQLAISQYKIDTSEFNGPLPQPADSSRKNCTTLAFVTIDSESTTDIDDAVCVEKNNEGYKLYVAIADASAYVHENTDLDTFAYSRGTTVYFQQHVYPMLPREISSHVGSLQPMVDRNVLMCEMQISTLGVVKQVDVYEATICSKAKLSYNEVTACIEQGTLHAQKETLESLHTLYLLLLEQRVNRGSAPIRSGDYNYVLNEEGRPVDVTFKPWHVSYGMIEECMLAANTGVARWLIDRSIPALYRHHKGPDAIAWANQKQYLDAIGLGDVADEPTPLELQRLVGDATTMGESFGVENAIRSTMRPASYQVENPSHYSLAYEYYTHFTSPLRRYADLTVHRVIKRVLQEKPTYTVEELTTVAQQCTLADKRAKKATRDEAKRLRTQYANKYVGETISMQLTGGNMAGWFLKSTTPPIETFVPMSPKSGWVWNPALQQAVNDKLVLKLGDYLDITINTVDLYKLRINATPIDKTLAPTELALS